MLDFFHQRNWQSKYSVQTNSFMALKIAIEDNANGFTERWKAYLKNKGIGYDLVSVSTLGIIDQLKEYDAFLWHVSHEKSRDNIMSKELVFALESAGVIVYPTSGQMWHFDDKIAQDYFFKANNFLAPGSQVIFDEAQAKEFLVKASYPLIAKLRRGSASSNVFMVRTPKEGRRLVRRAFKSGFPLYNIRSRYGDLLQKAKGFAKIKILFKWIYRVFVPPAYSRNAPREKGYMIFQDFIPNNGDDIRVVVVDGKAVALRRKVRKGDFRASGSGLLEFPNEKLDKTYIQMAFEIQEVLKVPSIGVDFIESKDGSIYVIEMSYGFPSKNFLDGASGYWTRDGVFRFDEIRLQEWMVDWILAQLKIKRKQI